jgi:osmoprotectant transport system substrate-binding protein
MPTPRFRRRRPGAARRLVCALVAVGALGSCSPHRSPPAPVADARSGLVVASFNFPESQLLAEIYAQALEHAGVPVRRELGLGPRELVQPALEQGFADVVPEYLGSALTAAAPDTSADVTDPGAARAALGAALAGRDLTVLEPAPAENRNEVAVTAAFAADHRLSRLSDLGPLSGGLSVGGPSECPARRYCLLGLGDVYGLHFARFMALDSATRARRALDERIVDAAVLFSTDGQLADGDLVALTDDRHLQPAENVVPVVRRAALERYGPGVAATLDGVSARLTTTALRLLNWRIAVAGRKPADEARGWLIRAGLIGR